MCSSHIGLSACMGACNQSWSRHSDVYKEGVLAHHTADVAFCDCLLYACLVNIHLQKLHLDASSNGLAADKSHTLSTARGCASWSCMLLVIELPVSSVANFPTPRQGPSRGKTDRFMKVMTYRLGSSRLRVDIGDSGAGKLGQ